MFSFEFPESIRIGGLNFLNGSLRLSTQGLKFFGMIFPSFMLKHEINPLNI